MKTMIKTMLLSLLYFCFLSLPVGAESLAGIWENQLGEHLELDSSGQVLDYYGKTGFDLEEFIGQLLNFSNHQAAKKVIVAEAGQAFSSDILRNQPDVSDFSQQRLLYGSPRLGEEIRTQVYYRVPVSEESPTVAYTVPDEVVGAASAGEILSDDVDAEEELEPVEEQLLEEELVASEEPITSDEFEPTELAEEEPAHKEQLEENFSSDWEENYEQAKEPQQATSYRRRTGQSSAVATPSSRRGNAASSTSPSSAPSSPSSRRGSSTRSTTNSRAGTAEKLPDAGEKSELFLSLLGLFSLSVASYAILRRRKDT